MAEEEAHVAAAGMTTGSIRYAIVDNANCRRTCQSGCETVEAGHFWTFWRFGETLFRIKAEQATLEHVQRL